MHNNYVRNKDGIWINSDVFREEAIHYNKYGYYNADPEESDDWLDYWTTQRDRCINGYEVSGVKIPGEFYFYLNFCPILRVSDEDFHSSKKKAKKVMDFPKFYDGDYNYFWMREIARNGILDPLNIPDSEQQRILSLPKDDKEKELLKLYDSLGLYYRILPDNLEGGKNLVVGKARRKGFSYKNASVAVNNFFHKPATYTLLMAYEKKYLFPGKDTIFGKCQMYINFVNQNTAWTQPSDYINRNDHIEASYKEEINGVVTKKGFLSSIEAITFKDNPDAGRGSDTHDIIGEEVGAWGTPGGLKATIAAMRASSTAGGFQTGMMTLFGTSGDMEKGTVDFADIFNNPERYDMLAFYDIWGELSDKVEGFFFPAQLCKEKHIDENGNSNLATAKEKEEKDRQRLINKGASSVQIAQRLQEEPLNSGEAFAAVSMNNFPVVELNRRLEYLKATGKDKTQGTPVIFYEKDGMVHASPILDGSANPLRSYRHEPADKRGCPVIYEHPVQNAEAGLYKIGYDPVFQDGEDGGTSLAAIIVYKCYMRGQYTYHIPVAEYIGRKERTEDVDDIAYYFARYYNAKVMYENNVLNTKKHFEKRKRLSWLCRQPDKYIKNNIGKSSVSRGWGCHMDERIKTNCELYTADWLNEVVETVELDDGTVRKLTTIDFLWSTRLIEELIAYFRKGNFDLVSALFMALIQVQEDDLEKDYAFTQEKETVLDWWDKKLSKDKRLF